MHLPNEKRESVPAFPRSNRRKTKTVRPSSDAYVVELQRWADDGGRVPPANGLVGLSQNRANVETTTLAARNSVFPDRLNRSREQRIWIMKPQVRDENCRR